MIDIATEDGVVLTVSADSTPIRWRAVAKDGSTCRRGSGTCRRRRPEEDVSLLLRARP